MTAPVFATLGGNVSIVYRRTRVEMPVLPLKSNEALEEPSCSVITLIR